MKEKQALQERSRLLEKLVEKTWTDEVFKARLLKEPAKAVAAGTDGPSPLPQQGFKPGSI